MRVSSVDPVSTSPTSELAGCLSDDHASAFIVGELPAPLRNDLADHLDICEQCRRRVSALAGTGSVTDRTSPEPGSDAGLRAGQALGRFSLIRLLGYGAMGEVWAARDKALDR